MADAPIAVNPANATARPPPHEQGAAARGRAALGIRAAPLRDPLALPESHHGLVMEEWYLPSDRTGHYAGHWIWMAGGLAQLRRTEAWTEARRRRTGIRLGQLVTELLGES